MVWYRVGAADETPGKSGLAHFLEHLLFKGTKKNPQGLFSQTVATIGGSENAFTSSDYTGYFQRTTPRPAQADDGVRVRPHDRSGAHRRRGEAGIAGRARRAQLAGREQRQCAALRADGSRALSEPSLRPAGDRLAPRDRRAHARRRARVLQALLHAQQRHPHRRRRRDAGRGEEARRGNLRPGSARRRGEAARASAGAEAGSAAHRHARRSARHPAEPEPLLSRAVLHLRPSRRGRGDRHPHPHPGTRRQQPPLSEAGGGQPASRSAPARATTAPRSTRPVSPSTRRRSPAPA